MINLKRKIILDKLIKHKGTRIFMIYRSNMAEEYSEWNLPIVAPHSSNLSSVHQGYIQDLGGVLFDL